MANGSSVRFSSFKEARMVVDDAVIYLQKEGKDRITVTVYDLEEGHGIGGNTATNLKPITRKELEEVVASKFLDCGVGRQYAINDTRPLARMLG